METDKRKLASELAKKINYADLFKDPREIKVEFLWRLYAQNIFATPVSAIQYQETKQAFFVGFSECFRIMGDLAIKFDEDTAEEILTRLCDESNIFISSLLDRTLGK